MNADNKRATIFGNPTKPLDTSDFSARDKPKPAPKPEEVRAVAEEVGFQPLEAKEPVAAPSRRRRAKSRRTAQFNIKLTPETLEKFWVFAEEHEGDGEKAMSALLIQAAK